MGDLLPAEPPRLAPDFARLLAASNPWGRRDITNDDVQAWLETVWLEMHVRGYARNSMKRVVCSWWRRAREDEQERARERTARIQAEGERKEVADLQARADNVVPLRPSRSYAAKVMG